MYPQATAHHKHEQGLHIIDGGKGVIDLCI